jgi:hypothetical protein
MRISIKRTGGFAGMTEDLGSAEGSPSSPLGDAIRRLESRAGVEEPIGADLFRYEIVVENRPGSVTLTVQDMDPPTSPALENLLGFLKPAGA